MQTAIASWRSSRHRARSPPRIWIPTRSCSWWLSAPRSITGATSAVIEVPDGRGDGLRGHHRRGDPVSRHPAGPRQQSLRPGPGPGSGPLLRGHRDRPAHRPPGLAEGERPLDDLRAAASRRRGGRACSRSTRPSPALRARGRRDPATAHRGDLGPDGPCLAVRAQGEGEQDGRAHRPAQPPGVRGAARDRGRQERALRPPAGLCLFDLDGFKGVNDQPRPPGGRRGAPGRRRR